MPCGRHLVGDCVPQCGEHLSAVADRGQAGVPREVGHLGVEPHKGEPDASAAVVGVGDDAEVRDAGAPLEVVFGVAFEKVAEERVVVRVGDVTTDAVSLNNAAADVPDSFLGGVVGHADGDASDA